jgi:hypothetical protein
MLWRTLQREILQLGEHHPQPVLLSHKRIDNCIATTITDLQNSTHRGEGSTTFPSEFA